MGLSHVAFLVELAAISIQVIGLSQLDGRHDSGGSGRNHSLYPFRYSLHTTKMVLSKFIQQLTKIWC